MDVYTLMLSIAGVCATASILFLLWQVYRNLVGH